MMRRFFQISLLVIVAHPLHSLAQPRPFQTTRLSSTGGAGVASLLVTEAAVLNPAAIAFFSDTFLSYQNTRTELRSESRQRETDGNGFSDSNRSEGYFVFDNSAQTKGGFSYQRQTEDGFLRRRMSATFASALSDTFAFGLTYKYTEDTLPREAPSRHSVTHPVSLGATWVLEPTLIVGLVWDDPGRSSRSESRLVGGLQYNITDRFMVMLDAGQDPTRSYDRTLIWRGALQYSPFNDFYVRGGRFQDRAENLEGEAWGVSWAGPRLGADFAVRSSQQMRAEWAGLLYRRERLTDVSFALNLRF